MLTLPSAIMACLDPSAPVFSKRVWHHALVLVVGAILTPGPRRPRAGTRNSVLRVMDLIHLRLFQRYHRVLSRDVWSGLELGRILLRLLIAVFAPRRSAFAPAPPRRPRQTERPRLIGQSWLTLAQRLADSTTVWTPLIASRWYEEPDRPVEILSDTAVWYLTGFPPVPNRWVLVRDPQRVFQTQALLCRDPDATPTQIRRPLAERLTELLSCAA